MEDNNQLKLDLEELRHLQSIAQRRRIISLLNILSKNPRLFSDILNSEKKFPPPPQSSQRKVSKSSAVSKISATKEVAASTTTPTKQLENQRPRHREVMSSAWRPKEEKKADEYQVPNSERFYVSMKIPNYVHEYEGCISKGKQHEKVTVSLAGKIAHKIQRYNSSNLFFYDLEGGGSKVQIVAEASNSELAESEFSRLHSCVMPGDLVGVVGFPGKTTRGDLSLFARSFVPLSKQRQTSLNINLRKFPSHETPDESFA
uniref:lysine--tRNA ligase-like n=1 Tax=Fragaria vesca subsp. vesca TaxID=101020 RepID=UPI0005C890DB|nr:PREDICTED: lysine--tRNA ligase-like [Fragaria vesca subsp. vesca]